MTDHTQSENTQSQENRNAPLTDLVDELEVMRKDDAVHGKRKPALAKKARMDRIYEDFNTKETVLEAIASLEAMKADLEKRKEEKEGMDVDTVNVQISAIDKAMEPLKVALESLKALSETNPAVVSLSQQLGQLEIQKNELSATLRNYEGIGDPSARIAAIDRAIEDFKAVIRYFEKTSERIADVDTRYAELPGEMAVPLPVNPEERRKVLALQKKTARKMRGTLRSLSVIEEPGRGQLAEGETIRERTEAFLGKEKVNEGEILSMKPDKREEIMALWYAGLEPDAENLRKVRAFFKSPDYLRVRTSMAEKLKREVYSSKFKQSPFSAFVEMIRNSLAMMYSMNAQQRKEKEEVLDAILKDVDSPYGSVLNYDFLSYGNNDKKLRMAALDLLKGQLINKFSESEAYALALQDCGLTIGNASERSLGLEEKYLNRLKIIIAENMPFIAEQLGSGSIGQYEIEYINKRLPGFITFNEQDGPAMLEDIPGTGGRDAINRLASLRYHAAKKEKKDRDNQVARERAEEQKRYDELQEKQRNAEGELAKVDARIREIIHSLDGSARQYDLLYNRIDLYDENVNSLGHVYADVLNLALVLIDGNGVLEPSEADYESKHSLLYLDQVIENAMKKANGFLTGKSVKIAIEESVRKLKSKRETICLMEKTLADGKNEYENNRRELSGICEKELELIDDLEAAVKNREAIKSVGNMQKKLLKELAYGDTSTVQRMLDHWRGLRPKIERLVIK